MSRKESFPITDDLLEKFVKQNITRWNKSPETDRLIVINLSMVRMQMAWVIPKILFAKGLSEKTGARVVAMTWCPNEKLTEFFGSFGVEHISLDELCSKNKHLAVEALLKTLDVCVMHNDSEVIKNSRINGLSVGKDVYEDILRTSSLSTLKTGRNKTAIKKYMHIAWTLYAIKSFSKKHKIEYAIMDDLAYHEGAFIKLYRSVGANVIACSNAGFEKISFFEDGSIKKRMYNACQRYKTLINDVTEDNVKEAEIILAERFAGRNGREIDRAAFAGKKVYSKEEMADLLGLDKQKKTIALMAHTFTDAVFNYGSYYFRDYYDWLDKTLGIAEQVTDVNWILKPHPTRKAYNESEDSIEMMYERHKKSHIFWIDDDISGESIKNISDVVVTIGGNVGAEYACFGIPAILVGNPWYSGFGYTIEPSTCEEYKQMLQNVSKIERLDDEQILTAKKLFYLRNSKTFDENSFDDELANLLNDSYKKMVSKMAINYFMKNDGTQSYNDATLKLYMEYAEKNDIRKSQYYIAGFDN